MNKQCMFATAAVLGMVFAVPVCAYNYRFNNTTGKEVEIAFKLAGIDEPTETIKVPAKQNDGKPGTAFCR